MIELKINKELVKTQLLKFLNIILICKIIQII